MTPYTKNIETFLSGFAGDQTDEFERQQDLSEALIRKAEKENAPNPFDELGEMDYPDTGIENFDGEDVPLHSK